MLVVQELVVLIDLEPTGISSWLRREVNGIAHLVAMAVALMAAALRSLLLLLVVVVVVDLRRGRTAGENDDDEVYRGEGLFVPPPLRAEVLVMKFGERDSRIPSWTGEAREWAGNVNPFFARARTTTTTTTTTTMTDGSARLRIGGRWRSATWIRSTSRVDGVFAILYVVSRVFPTFSPPEAEKWEGSLRGPSRERPRFTFHLASEGASPH